MNERKSKPESIEKREAMLVKGLDYAIQNGWENLTRDNFCGEIGIANGSMNYHFESMEGFKRGVMRKAVESQVIPVVAQGIANKCSVACAAPDTLKKLAIVHMMLY